MLLKQEIGGTKANSGLAGDFGFSSDDISCSAVIMFKKGKRQIFSSRRHEGPGGGGGK
jgi:hypothetical protein